MRRVEEREVRRVEEREVRRVRRGRCLGGLGWRKGVAGEVGWGFGFRKGTDGEDRKGMGFGGGGEMGYGYWFSFFQYLFSFFLIVNRKWAPSYVMSSFNRRIDR